MNFPAGRTPHPVTFAPHAICGPASKIVNGKNDELIPYRITGVSPPPCRVKVLLKTIKHVAYVCVHNFTSGQ